MLLHASEFIHRCIQIKLALQTRQGVFFLSFFLDV
jgi:hypothetical protein